MESSPLFHIVCCISSILLQAARFIGKQDVDAAYQEAACFVLPVIFAND
jgi:hypothetical protein